MTKRTSHSLEPHYRMLSKERLEPRPRYPVHIVLENIRSAFNVGSIFRTSDAGAVEHIHLCGYTCHPPNLKLAKTALGAFDYVPWTHHEDPLHAVKRLRKASIPIVAIETADDAHPLGVYEWPRPVAAVFGNEVKGITPELLSQCDEIVRIPMLGYKNTINVATAFGIVLYDILGKWGVLRTPGATAAPNSRPPALFPGEDP
ncbi:MAG TPA: RNA methyltransferase [Candidatus Hydrogenedentes bacterium]|nr:RNA methyltransferase [Candidatus Hydrogenedentota bacterium]HQE82528.1 RNA methyltransferase [Candidatus Hydrogenedentota bacterium]HQH51249.1 RNA methyltransferase [Candidatus Hydrogenedentota bacterium]HQM47330.1 RNA methyltransferase [Candidatus Hydrogenedentota bacterium]